MMQWGTFSIFIFGLFIVWFLLWKNYSKSAKQNSDRTFVLSTFVSTLAIVATVIASTLSASNQINQLKLNLQTSISNQQQQSVEQSQVVIVGSSEDMSVEEQLQQAELAFHAEQYQQMEAIYLNSDLKDSAIRNNNLGYAYANGLYVVPNLEIAEFYFDKAILAGCEEAYANKFRTLMVQEKFLAAEQLLVQWYNLNIHPILDIYFNQTISNSCEASLEEFCLALSSDSRIEILKTLLQKKLTRVFDSSKIVYDTSVGGYRYRYKKINTSHQQKLDSTGYDTIYTYEEYITTIVNDTSLNKFLSLNN